MLTKLLPELKNNGHRVLLFSQSTKMLNIIEKVLDKFVSHFICNSINSAKKFTYLRIDGSVSDSKERQDLIDLYNRDSSYFCFLLTTQTGGVGITLTGADRVIIFDPAWNPAMDNVCNKFF